MKPHDTPPTQNRIVEAGQAAPDRRAVAAWILYDVGNTLFLTGAMGLFFPLWITKDLSGDDASIAYTLAATMILLIAVAPVVGALSDQARRRMPFLVTATLICVGAMSVLGGDNLFLALGLFGLAVVSFSVANMLYNAMLPEVSTSSTWGTIGGLGAGIGYLGAILAVVVGIVFVEARGYIFGFRVIGLLFLAFTAPLMVFLRERPRPTSGAGAAQRVAQAFAQLRDTLRGIGQFPRLSRFLVARFWYTWVVNTASTFAVLYASTTVGLDERQIKLVLLVGLLAAIPSGLILGRLVDRVGPRAVLSVVLVGWLLNLLASIAIPWLELSPDLWWGVGVFSGVLVAGTWASDRPFMLRLTPPRYLGEFFGLHNLTGRLSSVAGYFTWGFVSTTLDLGQPAALTTLVLCVVIAFLLIRRLGDDEGIAPGLPPAP